jgi:pimeloyl-ACP methyl ester carboxylesterase
LTPGVAERPLARFAGARPPRPDWYDELALEPEQVVYPVADGVRLEVLLWGKAGRPGVLLAHGNWAHARWWGPVAPLLAQDYRVASLSWSGMGGSGWREAYTVDQQVVELFAAAEAAGLWASTAPPVFIAHSFGTRALTRAAAGCGDRLSGAIMVDGSIAMPPPHNHFMSGIARKYASLAEALARFDLKPPQDCENPYILDEIARAGLEQTGDGWRWRFDPHYQTKYSRRDVWADLAAARCRLAFVYGDRSTVVPPDLVAAQRSQAGAGTAFVGIPFAGHHVMFDQPIALTAALRALVEAWLGSAGGDA